MRRYGFLKFPCPANRKDRIYKIMVHETAREGVYVYQYLSREADFSAFDAHYQTLEDALEDWEGELDQHGWFLIGDPLPNCQHDCILPVRVKGRPEGTPQWGHYEILSNGIWVDYDPIR